MCKSFSLLLASLVALMTPALALVGPTSESGDLAAHVIMILNRSASAAGFCSGLVVAGDIVLTAAHCVAPAADMRVHFRGEAGAPVLLAVAEIAVHPGYRADAIRSRQRSIDMALIRLVSPLPSRFAAATLAGSGAVGLGRRFRIAGFGVTREHAPSTAGVLRVATLAVRAPLSSILLWAEDATGRSAGACMGDSGAPIFAEDETTAVAITSWASGSGKSACGVLTQAALIGPQRGWIDGVLRGWSAR